MVLGVTPAAAPAELRRAFRLAAKTAHPDAGGDPARFHELVAALRLLSPASPETEPATSGDYETLPITVLLALNGGGLLHRAADGAELDLNLPAGLRTGDLVRAGGRGLRVAIRSDRDLMVRGHDIWLTTPLHPNVLARGGRVTVDTPLGRRVVWITGKSAGRGLVRLVGQGLPPRGDHPRGHLFLRLTEHRLVADTAAQALRRRFAAAWAA